MKTFPLLVVASLAVLVALRAEDASLQKGADEKPASQKDPARLKALEKELSEIVLARLAKAKAELGTNSIADFDAVIRHAVSQIEMKGASEENLKKARENAAEFGDALVKAVQQNRSAGQPLAGRITRAELSAVMRQERPLWPFTTDLPLTVPLTVPEQPATGGR